MTRFSSLLRCSIITAFVSVSAVGCHESGTWLDDAGNFKRVFRVKKPNSVKLVHSWFWRSPHFTHEFEYYLQVESNADFQHRLLTMNAMKQITAELELKEVTAWSGNRPGWFASKPIADYEVWKYSNNSQPNFQLLIDRTTGDLFLKDLQL